MWQEGRHVLAHLPGNLLPEILLYTRCGLDLQAQLEGIIPKLSPAAVPAQVDGGWLRFWMAQRGFLGALLPVYSVERLPTHIG